MSQDAANISPLNVSFRPEGEPKGQPRPRAFGFKKGGKFMIRMYEKGTAEGWKAQVAAAAKEYVPFIPLTGPVLCDITFIFPRPKNHFRANGELKAGAPTWYSRKPDRDNCDKAVLDCLKEIGMWRDDSQVCSGTLIKRYALYGERPGAVITIRELNN